MDLFENFDTTTTENKSVFWYGICMDCCDSEHKSYQKLDKIMCIECNKRIIMADLSEKLSIVDQCNFECMESTLSKCRLCWTSIESESFPIWKDGGEDLSQKIQLCCSIKIIKNKNLPNDLCKICMEKLKDSYEFRKNCMEKHRILEHMQRAMMEDRLENYSEEYLERIEDYIAEEELPCSECPMICSTESELNIHRDSHHNKGTLNENTPKIVCQIGECNEYFCTFKERDRHRKSAHKNSIGPCNYICPYCGQSMKRLRAYKYHMHALHSDDRVSCTECGKFMNRASLRLHVHKVHRQATIACLECGLCINKYNYKRHIEQIHRQRAKFSCEICHKDFSNKWNLRTHIRTHTGEMPYSCPDCESKF